MTVFITTNTSLGVRENERINNVRTLYTEDGCLWLEVGTCENREFHIISIPVDVIEKVTVDVA